MQDRHELTTFVGIDLGGGKGKNTAIALLERGATGSEPASAGGSAAGVRVRFVGRKTPHSIPFYDEQLLAFIGELPQATLLAIDAPLTRTVCTRCVLPQCPGLADCADGATRWMLEKGARLSSERIVTTTKPPITPYTQRACEVLMHHRYGITPRETLGQGMGPLTARAHYLVRALAPRFRINENLLEVYPKATLNELCGPELAGTYKRTASTWRVRAEILESLGDQLHFDIWREGCLQDDHCFDAVICAYTGYLWSQQDWQLPFEDREVFEQDGWIWFPRPDERRS